MNVAKYEQDTQNILTLSRNQISLVSNSQSESFKNES